MKKLLGIIILGLLLSGNVYAVDPYSEENRKKSEIKINCKIEEIVNHYEQEDGRPTSLKNMFVTDVDLPSFIIETNSYEDEVWLNQVGIKAKKNFPSELIFLTLQKANKEDLVFAKKFTIKFKEKYKNGKEISFEIASSNFDKKKKLTLEYINDESFYYREASVASGGCHRIDPKNFVFEEIEVQNEITIAEYKARKEKELLNKKKEELKKTRTAKGKFELNCKNGAFVNPSTGEVISTFTSEMNYLLNVSDYTYQNLNSKNNKNYQFMNGGDFYPDQLIFYRLDSTTVQFASYNKKTGELAFVTHTNLEELSKYNEIKSQFDEINKRIPNYIPEIGFDGEENYNVSTELGNKEYNENSNPSSVEFLEFAKLGILVNYLKIFDLKVAKYECNKIPDLN